MTIDDFYVMFVKKEQKSSFCNIQTSAFSSLIRQTRIIDHFNSICNIALNTFIKLKTSRACISINQKSRSSQTQNLKQNSNASNSIFLQSITFFSILQVNRSIKDLKDSLTSSFKSSLFCALIRATITQLIFLLNSLNSFRQDISSLLTFLILT